MLINIKQPVISKQIYDVFFRYSKLYSDIFSVSYLYNDYDDFCSFLRMIDINEQLNTAFIKIDIEKLKDFLNIRKSETFIDIILKNNFVFEFNVDFSNNFVFDVNSIRQQTCDFLNFFMKNEQYILVNLIFKDDFSFDEVYKIIDLFSDISNEYRKKIYINVSFKKNINYKLYSKILYYFFSNLQYSSAGCEYCPYRNVIKNNTFYVCEKIKFSRISNLHTLNKKHFFKKYSRWCYLLNKLNNFSFINKITCKKQKNKNSCFLFDKYQTTIYNNFIKE